jgi:hypothetical protein
MVTHPVVSLPMRAGTTRHHRAWRSWYFFTWSRGAVSGVRLPSPSRRKTFGPESTLTAARCFNAPSPWHSCQVQGTGPPTDRSNCRRSTPGLNPTRYRDYDFHSIRLSPNMGLTE